MIESEYITKDKNGDMIINTPGLCNIFDVDKSTLTRWTQKGCPKIDKNKWNLKDVITWYFDRLEDGSDSPESREYRERDLIARTLYREEKAKRAKIEREKLQSQYIHKDEMSREWEARVKEITRGLNLWSRRLPAMLEARQEGEIEQILEDEIYDFFNQYYQKGVYIPKEKRA